MKEKGQREEMKKWNEYSKGNDRNKWEDGDK